MKKLKLIKDGALSPLKKLNEGKTTLKNPDKYVFQGVFTQCSTPEHKVINRNGRIYMEKELLRHLGYLRDMIKENNGRILGELDHPEGRFEVQMKEASHAITDLWYDDKTKCVMGRLEVLDTPNGKTLKSLIDAGFPLYVSSRAAGDVNEKTKEVELAQIFTYDVVCTPGFKEARLERIDESLNLSDKALKYVNEAISRVKNANTTEISVPKSAINESIANYKNVSLKSVIKPLLESDEAKDDKKDENSEDKKKKIKVIKKTDKKESEEKDSEEKKTETSEEKKPSIKDDLKDVQKYYKVMGDNNAVLEDEEAENETEENDSEEKETKKEELTDAEKEENRSLILGIVGLNTDGEKLGEEDDEDEDDKDDDDIVDIEAIEDEDDEKEEDDSEDKDETEDSDEEETKEDSEETKKEVKKTVEKKDKIKKSTDDDIAELESILQSVEKSEAVKESIIRRYPFSISLSESNFAKFASLRPKLKKRCSDFIEENQIFDINMINELWLVPLKEDKKMQQNWLKLASQADIDLYVSAPIEVQNAIEESAKFWVLETQEDVDNFWQSTGLRQSNYKKAMNERFIKDYQTIISEGQLTERYKLGYDMNIIKSMENWYNE